ncbi:MAG: hypothetical protein U9Q19_06415 [Pseudomonadota bacterium]|nr:hypothetical protein [Pseudomonadota bacterium]
MESIVIIIIIDISAYPERSVKDEPFWLIHPRNHPLSDKSKINQADLDGADLLLLAEDHCLAEQAMTVCHMTVSGL